MNVVALVALVAPSLARADACPPTAVIHGSGAVSQSLTKALVARGVQIEPAGLPAGPCPSLDVEVARESAGFHVRITDPWGRRAERTLADVLTAATLVETWARMDLLQATDTSSVSAALAVPAVPAPAVAVPLTAQGGAPLIAAPVTPPLGAPVEAAAPAAAEADQADAPAADAPIAEAAALEAAPAAAPDDLAHSRSRLLVDVTGELGLARDTRIWMGSAVTACVRIGFACAGALGRVAFARDGSYRLDGLGLLAVPLSLGRFTLTPAIGAGLGTQTDPDQRFGGRRGRRIALVPNDDDDASLMVEARVDLSLRISESFSLLVGGSASTTPDLSGRGSFLGSPDDTMVRAQIGILWGVP